MITLDTAVSRISADNVITRSELAATARLANAKRDPAALQAKLDAFSGNMTERARVAFDAFKTGVAAGTLPEALAALARPSRDAAVLSAGTSPLATRVGSLAKTAEQALVDKRALYQTMIDAHNATITNLEAEVKAIGARISAKTLEAHSLINDQNRLIKQIEEKRGMIAWLTMTGAASSFVTFGLGGLAAAGAIAVATSALNDFSGQLRAVEQRKSGVQNDLHKLNEASNAFAKQQSELGTRLNDLKGAQAQLEAARQTPASTLTQLQRAAEADQQLIANLLAQITVLTTMKASATGHEAALDKMIGSLKEGVDALTAQLARTNSAIVVGLIDVALTGFGVSRALRMEGLTIARRQLLSAGIDLARGDPTALAQTLVGALVRDGLVAATGSAVLAATVATVLQTQTVDSRAAVAALIAGASSSAAATTMTATQKEVMQELANETRFDVTALANAVLAAPALDDTMARTVLAMLRA
jgi:hypothetical protein